MTTISSTPAVIDFRSSSRTRTESVSLGVNAVMRVLCVAGTVTILAVLGLVVVYLFSIGLSSLSLDFFTKLPTGDDKVPGGMKNGIIGTLILVGMASAIGIPLGMLAGVFLAEYEQKSWIAAPVRFIADVLSGVPSIVVGILGYELLVVPAASGAFKWVPYFSEMRSFNAWAGAAALAFIMIPIITRTTEEMLRLVPNSYREAGIALGATKARTILSVVLPAATGSVVTGIMLAIARVAGETAPLLFTIGYVRSIETDPRNAFPSLTVQIYKYASDPSPFVVKQAWAGTLVLITMIFVLNLAIRFVTSRKK